MTRKRILLISASIGGGHVAAARALETAFAAAGAEVSHVDLLDYTTPPFRRLYRQAYFDMVRTAPEFVDWLGRRFDRSPGEQKSRQERLRARLTRLVSFHLPRHIGRFEPDVIVHTHFLAPEILSTRLAPVLRREAKPAILQTVVVTDFFAHSFWLQPGVARYFVASEEVAVHLEASGIEEARIQVTGIPVDTRFTDLEPKGAAREALGYVPERDLLLVMAGGMDKELVKRISTSLQDLRWPLTATFIFGRSENLLSAVRDTLTEATSTRESLVSFDLVGFTKEVPRYMSAADLLLGKPGGLTTSEALAAGLPLATIKPYPVQEQANTTYLLEHGAAMHIEPVSVLNYKVRRFFAEPGLADMMRQAALALGQPTAARDIAAQVLEELEPF